MPGYPGITGYPGMTKSDAKRENDEMPETLLFSALTTRGVENRLVDAALKLGGEGPFRNVPPQFGYWLVPRQARFRHPVLDVAERPR
jgi:hypothetical protein